jgi:hypothetical protein
MGQVPVQESDGRKAMSSQFFVERYVREKHQTFIRAAAHDRLSGDLRVGEHHAPGRPLRVQPAQGGAVVILCVASLFSIGLTSGAERLTTPRTANASVAEARGAQPLGSFAHVVDRWFDEANAKPAARTSSVHVVDR